MIKEYEEDLFAESTMSFGEHLEELRYRLWRAVLGLVVAIIIGLFVGAPVARFIQRPLTKALDNFYQTDSRTKIEKLAAENGGNKSVAYKDALQRIDKGKKLADEVYIDPSVLFAKLKAHFPDELKNITLPKKVEDQAGDKDLIPILLWRNMEDDSRVHAKSFNVHEPFGIYIKASIFVGLLIAGPWIFIQIWGFVAAGLYPHEKKYVHIYLPLSLALFAFGVVVAFSFVFEPVLNFLFTINRWLQIDPDPRISEWLSFVLFLPIAFGIGFQLPLVMFFLERSGIISSGTFVKHWKIAIFIIWILVSVLTPPDPYSQLLLGIPLSFLFFGGILLCKYMPRAQENFSPWDD